MATGMDTIAERVRGLVGGLPSEEREVVQRAYQVAEAAHRGQVRKHGAPYIEHPVQVAETLVERFGVTEGSVLAAGLLHDVVEDTTLTLADLGAFPGRTRDLVELLTDPWEHMSSDERREHYRVIWKDPQATLVKAADRLSNLHDALAHPRPTFRIGYARRTRNEMLGPGMPLRTHPVAGPLLEAAVRRCEQGDPAR